MGAPPDAPCRVRTITAGVHLTDYRDLAAVERALRRLARGRLALQDAGYEVQTTRLATPALAEALDASARERALADLHLLDQLLKGHGAIGAIGPCAPAGAYDAALAPWVAELVSGTSQLSCSVRVLGVDGRVNRNATRMAAEAMVALSRSTKDGLGNFRFAATACVTAGTPFFPAGFHEGPDSLAIGMESAGVVAAALAGAPAADAATDRVRDHLNRALAPVERIGMAIAARAGVAWLGIDTSPAPSLDRSIGLALESLLGAPFGEGGTVDACAAVTAALRTLEVKTCGYAGLMLPVLEDPILAQRASECRFGIRELLLYSSVCGTGLDLVPLAGSTSAEVLERIIRDTAALAGRWSKPLSARLLLVPGKKTGDTASFDDPLLTPCRVMAAG